MDKKIWLDSYPKGISHTIRVDAYTSLAEFWEHRSSMYASLIAFENMGVGITFQELSKQVDIFAAYLQQDAKLKKGDRIAIQLPNLLQYPIALFAAIKIGLIVVNTNPLYKPSEMRHQFKDAGVKAIVILENFASNLQKIIKETSIETVVVTRIGDILGTFKGKVINFVVKHIKKMVPAYHLPQAVAFHDALKLGKDKTIQPVEISPTDPALLQYTGGTTGVSKGAVLTHSNLIANLEQVYEWILYADLKEKEEIFITALPIYHVFAFTCNALLSIRVGSKNILITNPRDMKAFMKVLKQNRWTVMTGVNTLFNRLLNQPSFKHLDFSSAKCSIAGGMALQRYVANKWVEITGTPISEGYGLTETSPVLTVNLLLNDIETGYIGLPLPNTEIIIMDDDGKEVPLGEKGELCARGPQVFSQYWKNEEETKHSFYKDWFKTGDIAFMNEKGYLKIVDRKKEMILVSGFNVYPNEVEDCIASMEGVMEVGVIGVPDSKSGEVVKAYVVKSNPSLTVEKILQHCKKDLADYKIPKHVNFLDELPKSNIGKILRRVLKENDLKTNTYS